MERCQMERRQMEKSQIEQYDDGARMDAESFEHIIGYHCAPVIRGVKIANLVSLPAGSADACHQQIAACNALFNEWGLFFYRLCQCGGRNLLLVYRPKEMEDYLHQPEHEAFLAAHGYKPGEGLTAYLGRLSEHLAKGGDFPHEIGLFLGYPLADIIGFVNNRGAGYHLCGEWKVYSNVGFARQMFDCYEGCRRFCRSELAQGRTLLDLVAYTA